LKALQEAQIPIDLLAGSSIGSMIAVFYAVGIDLDMMIELGSQLRRKHFLDLTIPKLGLISGRRVKELIRLLTRGLKLEELPIPTSVVATDLLTGERVVFNSGPIDLAVRASISVPGVFEPVAFEDRLLVDGGVVDRVPISVVREMGADIVIAVDVLAPLDGARIANIFDVITQTLVIMEREIVNKQALLADCIIYPDVSDISPTSFHKVRECVQKGEEAAKQMLDKIRALLHTTS
jgi:NTE family protein